MPTTIFRPIAPSARRHNRRPTSAAIVCAGLLASALPGGRAKASEPASDTRPPAVVQVPPMGWNSWNSFADTIDSRLIVQQAQAIATNGMKDAGYEYIVLDEGWWKGARDSSGNIVVDPEQWPALRPGQKAGDMANIAAFIHGLGLKAGIYTDAGQSGCGFFGPDVGPPRPGTGSEDNYERDFLQFAKWGFDYVKVDWCGGNHEKLVGPVQYAAVARAIRKAEVATGHQLYFSICEWGSQKPWTWAAGVGGSVSNIWRTGGDIVAPVVEQVQDEKHLKRIVTLKNILDSFDAGIHPEGQHTGYYNDLDMMVIGMRGMTENWERIHMGLWALSSAPLLVGADITRLKSSSVALLTNRSLLEIHNDPLGLQAIKVAEPQPGLQVWAKPLAGSGQRAVALLNRTKGPARIEVDWTKFGLAAAPVSVRDAIAERDLGTQASPYGVNVPSEDVVVLTIAGRDQPAKLYPASSAGNERIGQAAAEPCAGCAGGALVAIGGNRALSFHNLRSATAGRLVRVNYRNRSAATVVARLTVNGVQSTGVAFPSTGDQIRSVTLRLVLHDANQPNALELGAPCGEEIWLEGVDLLSW
ncbi:MAG: alpha-galactosidase [Bryobacteraceae bacterium]